MDKGWLLQDTTTFFSPPILWRGIVERDQSIIVGSGTFQEFSMSRKTQQLSASPLAETTSSLRWCGSRKAIGKAIPMRPCFLLCFFFFFLSFSKQTHAQAYARRSFLHCRWTGRIRSRTNIVNYLTQKLYNKPERHYLSSLKKSDNLSNFKSRGPQQHLLFVFLCSLPFRASLVHSFKKLSLLHSFL